MFRMPPASSTSVALVGLPSALALPRTRPSVRNLMISNRLIIASSVLLVSVVSVVAIVVSRPEPKNFSPTAGCGSKLSWTFNAENHYNHTIGDRSFLVHIPAKYNFNTTHPVVFSFHGYGEDGLEQERISGFSEEGNLIDGKEIVAVYPLAAYGPGKRRKPARAWVGAPYSPPDVDDVGFVAEIIESLEANLCVDYTRIYASGMSNGGGFVNLLACSEQVASKFAAFAIVSGALYNGTHPFTECDPGRKIPLITFHGTADETIPYDGRNDTINANDDTPPIPEWREAWVARNGCDPSAPTNVSQPYEGVVETTWQCGDDPECTVKAFEIMDGIHKWPSTAETTFNATSEQILPFFNQFSLLPGAL
ncbi:carbohydrate esterase family 1 protein [Mycena olivaceomarginata]|nr:carbohydrate esterase family 1 protein [Mycena olivaceomarginata]